MNTITRRPVFVWVICVYCGLSAVLWIASIVVAFAGTIPLETAQQSYIKSRMLLSNVAVTILMLVAAFLLFKLHKSAEAVLGLLLGFLVLRDLMRYFTGGMTIAFIVAAFIGWLIAAVMLLYVVLLRKRGVLT